ncbi:unnamed protein product [Effrenium voratum]|uniref:DUF1995 domain-containing protein n=1 Tax=Effrenium voratum TaxID=2562239 RepID=A0AA36ISD1_9DINO|nr:unnamed protein product [Effrenium voratum]
MAALVDMGRVALDVLLAVGPMMSSEHVAKNQHVVQMRHSRLESFREDVRDLLSERLDSSQNLTLKSTLLFGFVTAILVEGFPSRKMKSEMCVDLFIFMVPWGVCLLFQSMTFAVLYQRGMVTVGAASQTLNWSMDDRMKRASAFAADSTRAGGMGGLGGMTEEKRMAMGMREEMVQATIEASTPVPQSFDQAVAWACSACLRAAEDGQVRQTMYFNTGAEDSQVTGELGGVLQFAEQVAKTLALSAKLPEGRGVRVLFTDFGAKSLVETRWGELPQNLIMDNLPPVLPKREIRMEERMVLEEILESSLLMVVAPNQSEMAAVLAIFDVMRDVGKKVPVVLLNPKLVQDTSAAAGVMLRKFKAFAETLLPVFHLEQFDPEADKDPIPLNSAVITRVWPRPFSVWEDNPEDPEAIDGYFLLDVNEVQAQDEEDCMSFLKGSRELVKRMRLKERQQREAGGKFVCHRHLRELQRIGAKQAEEELEQGNETFAEIISAKVRRTKERQGVLGVLWAVVARFFALPGPNELKRGMVEEDTDKEDFCSLASDTEVERSKSDVLSLDYLTQRLQGSAGAGSPVSANPKGAVRLIPNNLVHVTEMSKMPEVAALDLYEEQSHLTVVGGGLFTLMSLSFLVVTQLQMRAEVYEDHPMAFAARCGIFLPPLMVAGFASFIRPFPGKLQHEMPEDSINPHYIRPMTQCVVMVGAVISCTCLALALQLHTPPVAVGLTVTELSVDRWPLFFNPSGLVALEDSLLVTTDYRFARFKSKPWIGFGGPVALGALSVVADRFPGRQRGFTALDSNAVVRFRCGVGVAAHHGHGGLAAIWPLQPGRRLAQTACSQAPPELGEAYWAKPRFVPSDGIHVRYGLGGDLRWVSCVEQGALHGLSLRFEPEGFVRPGDSGRFAKGKPVERFQESLLPEGFLGHVLGEVVLPVKLALGIDLAPGEERLCYEHFVDVDAVRPLDLNRGVSEPPTEENREELLDWWRPQVMVPDPSKVYDQHTTRFGHFAPIGPGLGSEVSPFRVAPRPKAEVEDIDDDLKEIFMLGRKNGRLQMLRELSGAQTKELCAVCGGVFLLPAPYARAPRRSRRSRRAPRTTESSAVLLEEHGSPANG